MSQYVRRAIGYGVPCLWILVLVVSFGQLSPIWRFFGATVGLFLAVKVGAWVLVRGRSGGISLSPLETLLFWTVWPGVRPDRFLTDEYSRPEARTFVFGYTFFLLGAVLGVATLLAVPYVGEQVASWLFIFAVLFCVHFGIGSILPFSLRWAGFPVPPLFVNPFASTGIGDFWSTRWNRPFVGMNRLFLTRPLAPHLGFGTAALIAFLASGVLHELAISYPAGAAFGLPFLYFVLQSVLYLIERQAFPEDPDAWTVLRQVWTYAAILGPLPLLFHWPFRETFVVPVIEFGRSMLLAHPAEFYLWLGLWIGVAGHALVLVASSQVPKELEWHEDLQSLSSLNRKLLWTYGGFIVLTIVSFGILTAVFHGEFVAGNPVALGLSAMIAVFWGARILVDFFYFSHDDWPEGVEYIVGHALLTSLFVLLVAIYGGTIAFHLVG